MVLCLFSFIVFMVDPKTCRADEDIIRHPRFQVAAPPHEGSEMLVGLPAHPRYSVPETRSPRIPEQSVRQNFIFRIEHPVLSPQLPADFSPLVAVFKSFGGVGTCSGGALAGRIGSVAAGPGIDFRFHISKMIASFCAAGGGEVPYPRHNSFGLKN